MRLPSVMALFAAGCTLALLTSSSPAEARKPVAKKGYVGSETCGTCHAVEYKSWKESFHSKIVQTREKGILKDAVAKWATDGTNPGPTTGNVTGKRFGLDEVKYVVGSRWKQRYLVADESTGGLQFLNRQFNRNSGTWEAYGDRNDWAMNCGGCHTTGYRMTKYDPADPKSAKAEWSELGVGCEVCHGPGEKHARSKSRKDIWNFVGKSYVVQSRVCGYCHVRLENRRYRTPQGNFREDLPAPKLGESFKPSDDWTAWYPDQVVIPGIHPGDRFDAEYTGDLNGAFKVDEVSKASGVFEESKHRQQYQGFIQSDHYKSGKVSCITCHAPHAGRGKLRRVPKDACGSCHDDSRSVDTYLPNTGKTADNLFVRSHTFKKNPRPSVGPGADAMGQPEYYK